MKKIVMYTTAYCPYCRSAKQFFENNNWPFEEIDLSENREELEKLKERTHHRTVPQIFFGDHFIGGFSDMMDLEHKKQLRHLLD